MYSTIPAAPMLNATTSPSVSAADWLATKNMAARLQSSAENHAHRGSVANAAMSAQKSEASWLLAAAAAAAAAPAGPAGWRLSRTVRPRARRETAIGAPLAPGGQSMASMVLGSDVLEQGGCGCGCVCCESALLLAGAVLMNPEASY
jgi:hypothetical protein